MPEGRNHPGLNIEQWLHDTTTLNDYQGEMGNQGQWQQLYFRLLHGHSVQDANFIHWLLDIYKGSTWQLIIPTGLQIKCISAQNLFIQQAHDNTGHVGLCKTCHNLPTKYHWKYYYSDVKKFVESSEICQVTKSSTQKPVGLLTPLTVPQRPWVAIAMDFLFLKQLIVDCTKLIPGMKFSDKQKRHFVTVGKVLHIIDRHSGYTHIIHCTGEIYAAGVIDIFEKHISLLLVYY